MHPKLSNACCDARWSTGNRLRSSVVGVVGMTTSLPGWTCGRCGAAVGVCSASFAALFGRVEIALQTRASSSPTTWSMPMTDDTIIIKLRSLLLLLNSISGQQLLAVFRFSSRPILSHWIRNRLLYSVYSASSSSWQRKSWYCWHATGCTANDVKLLVSTTEMTRHTERPNNKFSIRNTLSGCQPAIGLNCVALDLCRHTSASCEFWEIGIRDWS